MRAGEQTPQSARHSIAHAEWPTARATPTLDDPLGLSVIARELGRRLVPRVTSAASRAQGFAVVLEGLAIAERAVAHYGLVPTDDELARAFERFERVWALGCVESRKGVIPRAGDLAAREGARFLDDAMPAIEDAARAWFPGDRELPREHPTPVRSGRLGALASYLPSLRRAGLVLPSTLRPSPSATPILAAFWDEPDANGRVGAFEPFLIDCMAPGAHTIPRRGRGVSLFGIGERSRPSSLRERHRDLQQERIERALFPARGSTIAAELLELVRRAWRTSLVAPSSETFLADALGGVHGAPSPELAAELALANAFGRVAVALSARFEAAWGAARGWRAPIGVTDLVRAAFPKAELDELRSRCAELLACAQLDALGLVQPHGTAFVNAIESMVDAGPTVACEAMLEHHRLVARAAGRDLLLREHEEHYVVDFPRESAPAAVSFPALMIPTLATLAIDLERHPS